MSNTREIILCTRCDGKGLSEWEECTNYHKREYDNCSAICSSCEGTGRVQKITTVKYEPYKQPAPTHNAKDGKPLA